MKDQLESQEKLLLSYSENYEAWSSNQSDAGLSPDAVRGKINSNVALLNDLLAKKTVEIEQLKHSRDETTLLIGENQALKQQIDSLMRDIAEKQSSIDQLKEKQEGALGDTEVDKASLDSKIMSLETKIGSL